MRSLWFLVLLGACTFSNEITGTIDAPLDVVDTPEPTVHWAVVATTVGGTSMVTVIPVRDGRFESACPSQPVPGSLPLRDLLAHPTLSYVYGVESGFHGTILGCGALSWSGMPNVTALRPIQRIAYDASVGVGFFTGDGMDAIGLYRFTTAADGTPTVGASTNTTAQAGALMLDRAHSTLYVVGASVASSYVFADANLTLPASRSNASACVEPVDVAVSGDTMFAFCSDSPEIRKYSRNPFVFASMAGSMGAVDRVVAISNDRAIAARTTPDLMLVDLGGGTPTWQQGPALGSRVTALGVSNDGSIIMTARPIDSTTSELASWRVEGQSIIPIDTKVVPGDASALTVALPGT
jgi:hypothetical protein